VCRSQGGTYEGLAKGGNGTAFWETFILVSSPGAKEFKGILYGGKGRGSLPIKKLREYQFRGKKKPTSENSLNQGKYI